MTSAATGAATFWTRSAATTACRAIRLNPLGAYALGLTDTYQPRESEPVDAQSLKVLPNLDIVATGNVPTADRLTLSGYAKQSADHVWTVSASSLLSAIDAGRDLAEFAAFLDHRVGHELPDTLKTLVADVGAGLGSSPTSVTSG